MRRQCSFEMLNHIICISTTTTASMLRINDSFNRRGSVFSTVGTTYLLILHIEGVLLYQI